jgi:hypothetical protein
LSVDTDAELNAGHVVVPLKEMQAGCSCPMDRGAEAINMDAAKCFVPHPVLLPRVEAMVSLLGGNECP